MPLDCCREFSLFSGGLCSEVSLHSKLQLFLSCTLTAHVHILPFVHVAMKMKEEEEIATLEKFMDFSILEFLLNPLTLAVGFSAIEQY